MRRELPGGGRPWFVRQRKGRCGYQLAPASPAGWAATAFYVAAVTGAALLLLGDDPRPVAIFAWALLMLVSTALYLLAAFRMSVSAEDASSRRGRKGR